MAKLIKINKDAQKKFIIGLLILIIIFAFFFWFFIREQERAIAEHHIRYMKKADATITTLLGQARLNSYVTAKEIAVLLRRIKDEEIGKKEILDHLEIVEKREEAIGILLNQHILLVVDMEGDVIARSEWIREERVPLLQEGNIRDDWIPCVAFEQAFTHALGGEPDVRKIIYNRDFLRREGYDFWDADGMGLTVMTPIMNENEKQKGVLISITFVNANAPIIAGLKAVTDASFTAILPSGEVIGSYFDEDSAEKIEEISRSPELLAVAKKRAEEKRDLIKRGISIPDADFILEEFTIEKIRLTHVDVFGEEGFPSSHYYRVVYWLELDPEGNFAALRGIAMNIDVYVAQKSFFIHLIAGTAFVLIIFFWFFYFLIQNKLVRPITSFTAQLLKINAQKEGGRVEIQKKYQEFKELEDTFNSFFDQVEEARGVLDIKVKAKTKQLSELSASLEKQVKEKTKDLQVKVDELERFKNVTVGRELRMVELKEEIERLKGEIERIKKELGKPST